MSFFFGEYGGEFLILFWEFDFCHACVSSKLCGNGGFVDSYCGELPIQLLEFVDGWCYVFFLEVVDEIFISVNGIFPDILLQRRLVWVRVVVVFPCTISFFQL